MAKTIVTYNNSNFEFELVLINQYNNIIVPHNAVESIVIIDNIYSVFDEVIITLKNSKNVIDNYSNYNSEKTNQILENLSFNFLGSGNDYFTLKLKPKTQENTEVDPSDINNNVFDLEYTLIIDDEDELLDSDGVSKIRVYKCKDVREFILENDYRGYSTINEPNVAKYQFRDRQIDNDNRRSKTGDFIKYVLNETLSFFKPTYAVDWDRGDSILFYTSPQNFSAFDDIDYVLSQHVSSVTRDNCILKAEKGNVFSLRPYTEIINLHRENNSPGKFLQDFFTFQDNTSMKNNPNQKQTDNFEAAEENAMQGKKFSWDNITNIANLPSLPDFNFLNRTGIDGYNYLITYRVHAYDLSVKQFEIYQHDNNIEAQKKFIDENYIKKFGGNHGSPNSTFFIDQIRKQNINCESNFSLPDDSRIYLKSGRNKSLQKYIDSAPSISFSVEGFSNRKSCRFMTLTNSQFENESVFANLFSGEWLVTQVVHTFTNGNYINNITGVKMYYYDKISAPTVSDVTQEKINRINSIYTS